MIKTIKVIALKAFDAGKGIVKKGDIIEIPEELLPHFLRNGKVAEIVKEAKAKLTKVIEDFKPKEEPIVKKKRTRKSKK